MIVYAIRNDVNDLVYVGQTVVPLAVRFGAHLRSRRDDMTIARAIREIGREHFRVEVLEECRSQDALDRAERTWIESLDTVEPNGYNRSLGTGRHERTRALLSESLRGRSITWGGKISAAMSGRKASPSQREGLAIGRAQPRSATARARMGRNNRHRKLLDSQVLEIRRLAAAGNHSQEALAAMFDVRQTAISRIARRVSYSWLPEED